METRINNIGTPDVTTNTVSLAVLDKQVRDFIVKNVSDVTRRVLAYQLVTILESDITSRIPNITMDTLLTADQLATVKIILKDISTAVDLAYPQAWNNYALWPLKAHS